MDNKRSKPAKVDGIGIECQINDPDYKVHPAYGGAFRPSSAFLRVRALTRLAPWIVLLMTKRVLDLDRRASIPGQDAGLPPGIRARIQAGLRHFPRICRTAFSMRRLRSSLAVELGLTQSLLGRGIVIGHMPTHFITMLCDQLKARVQELTRRKRNSAVHTLEQCQIWLSVQEHIEVYRTVQCALDQSGATAAVSEYLGREISVRRLLLQLNEASDDFWFKNPFADVGLSEPATYGFHMDTNYGVVKCMIYLSHVNEDRGPFCYACGTHRWKQGFFEGLVRRAVDRSGLGQLDPVSRELFMALPATLRKKGSMGSDYLNGSEMVHRLLRAEYRWTSQDGNFALFDPLGIHRGARLQEGARLALFAILS